MLGNSYFLKAESYNDCNSDYLDALKNYKIALQKEPNNNICLRNCAYIYEKRKDYSNTLKMLDKLLSINKEDSLIFCYYGEILSNMKRYRDAISYFTKANMIDPENVHNLNKRAFAYYNLQEHDKALLDFNKVVQLDLSNSFAYYHIGLIHHAKGVNNNSMAAFEKCIELDSNNNLVKMQFYYLKVLTYKQSSNNLNDDIITNISQIPNINNDKSLLFIKCKIYIELEKYKEAKSNLRILFKLNDESFAQLSQYLDFWSYIYKVYKISDYDFTKLGIVNNNNFDKYMYKGKIFKLIIIIL
jgi:tetratricopeptide (TPR) repeat protein